jgi:hypothetical protein
MKYYAAKRKSLKNYLPNYHLHFFDLFKLKLTRNYLECKGLKKSPNK